MKQVNKIITTLGLLLITSPVFALESMQHRIDSIGFGILNANKINKRMIFTYDELDKKHIVPKEVTKREIIIYGDTVQYAETDDEVAAMLSQKISNAVKSYEGAGKGTIGSMQVLIAPKKYEMVSDKRSVDYMVRAGYNPLGLITFINKTCPQKKYDLISKHNLTSKRLDEIYAYILAKYPYFLQNNTYVDNIYYQNFLLNSIESRKLLETKLQNNNSEQFEKPKASNEYDFTDTDSVTIKLNTLQTLSTRDKTLHDAQDVKLIVKDDYYYKDELIAKKGEIVSAKVETIISSGMNGIPYYIYLGDFKFDNLSSSKLLCHYSKGGVNRMYWVMPLKWSLTFLPPTGSLTNFIKGGHAKIKPDDVITVQYFPNWK